MRKYANEPKVKKVANAVDIFGVKHKKITVLKTYGRTFIGECGHGERRVFLLEEYEVGKGYKSGKALAQNFNVEQVRNHYKGDADRVRDYVGNESKRTVY